MTYDPVQDSHWSTRVSNSLVQVWGMWRCPMQEPKSNKLRWMLVWICSRSGHAIVWMWFGVEWFMVVWLVNASKQLRQGGPGMKPSAEYPRGFAKKIFALHQRDLWDWFSPWFTLVILFSTKYIYYIYVCYKSILISGICISRPPQALAKPCTWSQDLKGGSHSTSMSMPVVPRAQLKARRVYDPLGVQCNEHC